MYTPMNEEQFWVSMMDVMQTDVIAVHAHAVGEEQFCASMKHEMQANVIVVRADGSERNGCL